MALRQQEAVALDAQTRSPTARGSEGDGRAAQASTMAGRTPGFEDQPAPLLSPLSNCASCRSTGSACVRAVEPAPWQPRRGGERWQCNGILSLRCCATAALLLSLALFGAALTLPHVFESMLVQSVRDKLSLEGPDAAGLPGFESNVGAPDKVRIRLHVMDLSNPVEVVLGAKPTLVKRGPFVFDVLMDHLNVSWSEDGELIHFNHWQRYVAVPELSVSDPAKTEVTTVNVPFLAVYYGVVAQLPAWTRAEAFRWIYRGAKERDVFARVTVEELLFGYDDPRLIKLGSRHPAKLSAEEAAQVRAAAAPQKSFRGLLGNMTAEAAMAQGLSSMHTGKYIHKLFHNIEAANGEASSTVCPKLKCKAGEVQPLWRGMDANRVKGSDGTYFSPDAIRRREPLELWVGALRTAFSLHAQGKDPEVVDGMEGVRYSLPTSVFANSTREPSHAALYMDGPDGLFNYTRLALGLPIFVSKPHFLDADPGLLAAVEGLAPPSRREHDFTMLLHERMGVPVRTFMRLQFNMRLQEMPMGTRSAWLGKVREVYLPVMSFEIVEQLSTEHRRLFHKCQTAIRVVDIVHVASYVLGSGAILAAILANAVHSSRVKRRELLRRSSSLYHALLAETGDSEPFFYNSWVERRHAFAHPHLRKAVLVTAVTAFMVNMAIELVRVRKVDAIGLLEPLHTGHPSVLVSVLLTTALVPFFATLAGCSDAKLAVQMGFFPTLHWPALGAESWRGQRDPWLFFLRPVRSINRYILLALANMPWFTVLFAPLPVVALLVARFAFHVVAMSPLAFCFAKACLAALESVCAFVPAYLRTAASPVAPLHDFMRSPDRLALDSRYAPAEVSTLAASRQPPPLDKPAAAVDARVDLLVNTDRTSHGSASPGHNSAQRE